MKPKLNELADEDLKGHDITEVKCRACSGYGACGFKTFYMHDGKPYSVCNLRLSKIKEEEGEDTSGN